MDFGRLTETRAHNEQRKSAGKLALEKRPVLEAQRRAAADARGRR